MCEFAFILHGRNELNNKECGLKLRRKNLKITIKKNKNIMMKDENKTKQKSQKSFKKI